MKMTIAPSSSIETPLLKGPLESLKRAVRERKSVIEDVQTLVSEITRMTECAKDDTTCSAPNTAANIETLDSVISKLQGFKRKLQDTASEEEDQVQRCRARIQHLALLTSGPESVNRWRSLHLDRLLVDHMLRCGYYDAAKQLAESSKIQDLVDMDVFYSARNVVDALKKHSCTEALQWCAENSTRLKKMKSKLEFKLRKAEFLELVCKRQLMDAITYARKHLAPWAKTHMKELQQAMATLVFVNDLEASPYKHLFDDSRWEDVIDTFHQDNHRLNNLTLESLLTIYLQAGLSVLKTPFSYQPDCNVEDPLHWPKFQTLAAGLPYAKHLHSKLVCFVTKELMNEDNPPMVLPNGYVYSYKALQEMAQKNSGTITCPRTGFRCEFHELSKAFVS
mmetsp:Transcript_5102/g.10456  ORF Transcript_5102/g.10456 Transcript_5102/m.10456 type:complete len:393 (-) Transcript_5102:261-1439(-)|eukprot:CAMPEP_0118934960 /NCGR_PEP_ID=MMETSP1169-20130426/14598_1 /TAXON_ID=36882 /ORGANISM="Pyramimonas obovata, Strain CCMP722" /LENGTH=392 /DNA_ID=CAMNT_0006877925 /DNA_START=116 /DNA_END=1294 /DNA_ORIENTATION=-